MELCPRNVNLVKGQFAWEANVGGRNGGWGWGYPTDVVKDLCQRQGKKGERERETEKKGGREEEGRKEEKKEGRTGEKGKKDRYLLIFPQLKNLYKILGRPYTYMAPTRMGQKNIMFGCCCACEGCRITM